MKNRFHDFLHRFYAVSLRIENQYGLLIPGSRRALDRLLNLLRRGHPREVGIDSALDARVLKSVREEGMHNEFKTLGKIINGEITTRVPASALRRHKNTTVILDKDAASGLKNNKKI